MQTTDRQRAKQMPTIEFTPVVPTEAQVTLLHELLMRRTHSISHGEVPHIDRHREFVKSHPYRAWYLVSVGGEVVGTFYVSHENTVGVNIGEQDLVAVLERIVAHVAGNYSPLPGIPSVRSPVFLINVPPDNLPLQKALERLDKKILQITYSLE